MTKAEAWRRAPSRLYAARRDERLWSIARVTAAGLDDERKRRREERERATKLAEECERRSHHRFALVAASLAVISASAAIVSGALPDRPAPVAISAEISHTGTMELTMAKPLRETTSPACGCLREDPPGGWQGIVVPARALTFARTDDGSPTQYDVFNPGPAQWSHLPNSRGTEARIGPVLLPSSTPPTAEAIQGAMALNPKAFRREAVDVISITTSGALWGASLGREPVAALGIPARTPASIDYKSTQKRRDATLTIRAPFASPSQGGGDQTNTIPLLDILGPRVLLWAPTHPKLAFTVAVWHDPPPPYTPGGSSPVGPDSFHVGFQEPLPESTVPPGHTAYTVVLVDRGAFAVRIAPRPGAGDAWTTVAGAPTEAGQMQLTVPQVASQADALVPVFGRANANPKAPVRDIPFMTDNETVAERQWDMPFDRLYRRDAQDFELPPTPPESGINVFGEIDVLRLSDARGVFTIGKKPLDLRAKTPLELRQFSSRRHPKHRLLIPVQMDATSARFDVQGSADTRLNGEPLATSRPWIATALAPDIVTLICAAITVLFLAMTGREFRKLRDI